MTESWLAHAVDYAVEQGVSVINLSWNFRHLQFADITIAFQKAFEAGIISFTSAGNGNQDTVYRLGHQGRP
jgi:hypothetical protein